MGADIDGLWCRGRSLVLGRSIVRDDMAVLWDGIGLPGLLLVWRVGWRFGDATRSVYHMIENVLFDGKVCVLFEKRVIGVFWAK